MVHKWYESAADGPIAQNFQSLENLIRPIHHRRHGEAAGQGRVVMMQGVEAIVGHRGRSCFSGLGRSRYGGGKLPERHMDNGVASLSGMCAG